MVDKQEYIKKFKRCILEYTSPSSYMEEDGEDDMNAGAPMGGDPSMGGAPAGDPSMGGAPDMGGDPSMGGAPAGDPAAAAGGAPDAGAAPADGGAGTPPEGFQPQGVDASAGLDGMGSDPATQGEDPAAQGAAPEAGDDEEVIDVDDLTDSQKETEDKVEALSGKFERVLSSLDNLEKKISDIDRHTNEYLGNIESEIEKRNPTPMQRMSMRSTKSAPYAMTPDEYMNNYAPDNYSAESDNNGADDPQYKITKSDVDNFRDYSTIAKEFGGNMGLRDILGY